MTLDDFLRAKNMTEAEFARQVGVSQPQINRLRKGQTGVSIKVLAAIKEATNGEVMPNDFIWPAPNSGEAA